MVTVNNDFAVFVLLQFRYSFGYFTHWDQDRAFNFDTVILILFSTVDKDEALAGVEFCFDRLTIHFHDRRLLRVQDTSDTRLSVIRLKSILLTQMLVAIDGSGSTVSGRWQVENNCPDLSELFGIFRINSRSELFGQDDPWDSYLIISGWQC